MNPVFLLITYFKIDPESWLGQKIFYVVYIMVPAIMVWILKISATILVIFLILPVL